MRKLILLCCVITCSVDSFAQEISRADIYSIVNMVLSKENTKTVYEIPYKDEILHLTDTLARVSVVDTTINFSESQRADFVSQFTSDSKVWNKKRLSKTVVGTDSVKAFSNFENSLIPKDYGDFKADQSFFTFKVSVPIFTIDRKTAFVFANHSFVCVHLQEVVCREGSIILYILSKKGTQWNLIKRTIIVIS